MKTVDGEETQIVNGYQVKLRCIITEDSTSCFDTVNEFNVHKGQVIGIKGKISKLYVRKSD